MNEEEEWIAYAKKEAMKYDTTYVDRKLGIVGRSFTGYLEDNEEEEKEQEKLEESKKVKKK